MNAFTLAIAAIKNRPLHSCLSVISVAAGIALLAAIFLLSNGVQDGLARNSRGIDIVAGAKGSPSQLVLSTIYHSDIPNGNIDMDDYQKLAHNPQVKQAIPITIGDNYKGWRIVGTTKDYLDLYRAEAAQGRVFAQDFEVVVGASTGLKIGDEFAALHGFAADSDDVHNFHLYKVVGILKPTGTVLDRLLITTFESVQQLHSHPDADDPDAAEEMQLGHQVTAVLIKVRSPIAVMNLPREINRSSNILAASPSFQMARLSQSLGMGRDVLTVLGVGIVILSVLMLLSVLASGLAARRYDLAVLRVLGASPSMLSITIISEAFMLSAAGSMTGLIVGHTAAAFISTIVPSLSGVVLPGEFLLPGGMDMLFLCIGAGAGLIGGAIPAISAGRTDIAALLARGKI